MEKLKFNPENNQNDKTESVNKESNNPEKIEPEFLGRTKDGKEVYDRGDSHIHYEDGLNKKLLESALGAITTRDRVFIKDKVEFDDVIGYHRCIEVGPDDDVELVFRKGRHGRIPMVRNREPELSNSLVTIMLKDREDKEGNRYVVLTSYIGGFSEREPWDASNITEDDRRISKEFWDSHALVYDEEAIDWDKTRAFQALPEEQKELEPLMERTMYNGLFVDREKLYEAMPPTLKQTIKDPHVTITFQPWIDQLRLEQLGEDARIMAVGYGNDGKNEGLLVRIEADDPVLQEACDKIEVPHITLSFSPDSHPKETSGLEFTPLEKPFEITGKYGFYSRGNVVCDKESLDELEKSPYY